MAVKGPKPYLREISLKRERIAAFDRYPFNIAAVRELDFLEFHPDVTFFVGENGSGKSTMLEAIALAMGFGPEGGTRNMRFNTADTTSGLHNNLRIVRGHTRPRDYYFLRAESFFNVASEIERLDREPGLGPPIMPSYGDKSLHGQSHGESFMALLANKLRGDGLYLFDEPEAALSPSRQMAALVAIHQLVLDQSQFIIATHSPILLAYPRARIVLFDGSGLSEVRYEDTEHYAVTRRFLNDHRRMVENLLADD
ncbi:MAG TPA: AAA family ATPase [Nevskia sp.]|nr:AAA family ATPase [Nevskia sp.]